MTWGRFVPSHSLESFLQVVWVRISGLIARTASVPSVIQQSVHLLFLPGHLLLFREIMNYFHLQKDLSLPVPFLKSIERTTGHQTALLAHTPAKVQSPWLVCGQWVSTAELSLLLVGSRRGLVCLYSQVYIFVCRPCRASFYSVLSPAWCLLMHVFLSFAASKATDKTSSSLISI